MDWLTKLPVVGPWVVRLMRTHAWRAYERLDAVHWSRLAAAITFLSFLALFPLITVGAAIGAALLSPEGLASIEKKITDQVPGISEQLDIAGLVANAGAVGLVAGGVLLFMGIGWIGSMRDCLRAVWELDGVDEGNPFVRKGKDAIVLLGLGGVLLGSLAASWLGATAVGWTAGRLGISHRGAGGLLLEGAAILVAIIADFLILTYVLTLLPGVEPRRRDLVVAALIGSVGFELLKLLLGGYMKGVAAKSMYGAFGVPVALLLWINFMAKLLLFCAAWTATGGDGAERPAVRDSRPRRPEEPSGRTETTERTGKAGKSGKSGNRPGDLPGKRPGNAGPHSPPATAG
ncbi:YhjD/YihY/BrkB family envelope integrity protein [Streptomyces sp. NPDC048718]|uniref:YihY/virulence factor BrkB family protein n=1 Tax=Streptomyces sp. NPDC048718 TaxID=3365587 RepID=UPI00371BFD61